ncbi:MULTISPECIES: segregation and condensation protein A [Gemella]|uniref:segregation and condensation protein A n=1 Tax=Gemella TaxID=1378 RepID=UPI000767F95F|nr:MULTISPECIES: segregation/condensation protein A [Gemella]AME09444.1 chromosome segregation protein ScpA [Gemella sp. oral taxon 928]AXI27084.1 chromosome segregation protein ScpA [Gemella sp. ND 6198]
MYNVELEVFQGPLDLLLHLIEKMEIDIYNIPMAKLTESYLEYINNTEEFSLENAEEYIVMAATLLHIKSKNLLPVFDEINSEETEEELVQQLIEYKNYKELSIKLQNLKQQRELFLDKESHNIEDKSSVRNLKITSDKLLKAMEKVLKSYDNNTEETLISYRSELSLEKVKHTLLNIFKIKKKIFFSELISYYDTKQEIVLVFISILGMIKDQDLLCIIDDNEINLKYLIKEE